MNGSAPPPTPGSAGGTGPGSGAGPAGGPAAPAVDWVVTSPSGSWGDGGWQGPGWAPGPGVPPVTGWAPAPGVPLRVEPAGPAHRDRRQLALVALVASVAGAAVATVVASLVFLAGAERMGEAMGEEIGDRVTEALGLDVGWSTEPLDEPLPAGPVEQTEPAAPGDLGPDPVLDAYAQQCFDGDLQSCDDLFHRATPGSGYEGYGTSCGGRVEPGAVWACTDLD